MTHSVLLLILDALAVYRLTRLIIADTILQPLRDRLIGHTYEGQPRDRAGFREARPIRAWAEEWIGCPWCVSPYMAVIVIAAQALFPTVWLYPALVLAFSAVTGLMFEAL